MTTPATESGRGREYPREPLQRRFAELTTSELHDILELRSNVFIVEQACVYDDIDGRDNEPNTFHIWFGYEGAVAAYLRQLEDPDGAARIGRVVTHPQHRGNGLAQRLLTHVIAQGRRPIVLDAQAHLADWYKRLDFHQDGDEYVEDGIAHIPMRLDARSHPVE